MRTQRKPAVCGHCCCRRRCARLSLPLRCPFSEPFRTEIFTVYVHRCVLYAARAVSQWGILGLGLQCSASGVRPKESQRRSLTAAGRTTVQCNAHTFTRCLPTDFTQHMHRQDEPAQERSRIVS